jgi:hypothetical protein
MVGSMSRLLAKFLNAPASARPTATERANGRVVRAAKALRREFDAGRAKDGRAHVSVDAMERAGEVTPAFLKLYWALESLLAAEEIEARRNDEFVIVLEQGATFPGAKRRKDVGPLDKIIFDHSGDYHTKSAKLAMEDYVGRTGL